MDQLAPGVTQLRIQRFVNVYFVESGLPGEWVLVDTGLPGSEQAISEAAEELFGVGARPQAILLTHGHLDHLGSAKELAAYWQVPVLAHPLEMPYITGQAQYPPNDPTVGGSLGFMSRFFPSELPNLRGCAQALLTDDPQAPFLPGWRWVHVPGHAPGQVAFFRESDETLLAGDAFATTHHDSIPSVLMGKPQISRAGTPYNYDWEAVRKSVQILADLNPVNLGCGHGPVMKGLEATASLRELADNYPIPTHGRYVHTPARTDASGVEFLPPPPPDRLPVQAAVVGASILAAGVTWFLSGTKKVSKRKRLR